MDFLGIGPIEFLVIGMVAFLFLGPARMVEVARSLGRVVQEVRRATGDLTNLMALDEPLDQPSPKQAGGTAQGSESATRKEGPGEG